MNDSLKIVSSKTLENTDWNNLEIMKEINPEEIKTMKRVEGKDNIIFGSGSVVGQLTNFELVDEYRFLVNPVFIGIGKTIFTTEEAKLKLKLLDTKTFGCGNIMLHYKTSK